MTKKEREAKAWTEYYRAISSYEAWEEITILVKRVKSKLKKERELLTQYETESYEELKEGADRLSELSEVGYEKYCEKKPQKPGSRPYGDL